MIRQLFDIKTYIVPVIVALLVFSGVTALFLKIRTLERDQAVFGMKTAQATAEAYRRESILIRESFERARKADHDRNQFVSDNALAVEKARQSGDRPLSPILRDAVERVRLRYQNGLPRY